MKRLGGDVFEQIVSIENLIAADIFARIRKDCTKKIATWDADWFENIARLHAELKEQIYTPSGYHRFTTSRADGSAKIREIFVCKAYRDRIVHHAVIQVLSPYLKSKLTTDTYATIPGKGPHVAIKKIKRIMRYTSVELHCLKMDVRKFYPNIDNEIMISVLKGLIKCDKTIELLSLIVKSSTGLPIGNLTSQWFGNLYLNQLDHLAKERWRAKHYFRYCDDIVLIDSDKLKLNELKERIIDYLNTERKLEIKPNRAIFKIGDRKGTGRGIDFLGYVFYRKHSALRKSTKVRWRRKLKLLNRAQASTYDVQAAGSLHGILKHCDSKNLLNTFKNDYPEYFKRLQQRDATKRAADRCKKQEVEAVFSPDTNHS